MFKYKLLYYLSSRNYIPGYNTFHYYISKILKSLISKKYFLVLSLNQNISYKSYSYKYKSYNEYKKWQVFRQRCVKRSIPS